MPVMGRGDWYFLGGCAALMGVALLTYKAIG